MTQQHQVYFEMSQDKSHSTYTVMIPVEIHPRSSFSSLDATSLKYESYSLANKEIMKLKLKTRRKGIKEQLGKGKDCEDLRYIFFISPFFYGDVYTGEPMRIES